MEAAKMRVSEPRCFCLLHIYEHVEAAALPCSSIQQTWGVCRRKDDVFVVSKTCLHCGVRAGAVNIAKEEVGSDCVVVNG